MCYTKKITAYIKYRCDYKLYIYLSISLLNINLPNLTGPSHLLHFISGSYFAISAILCAY